MLHSYKTTIFTTLFALAFLHPISAKNWSVKSPNGKLVMTVRDNPELAYCLVDQGDTLLSWSPISLQLETTTKPISVTKGKITRIEEHLSDLPLYRQQAFDHIANQLQLSLSGGLGLTVRASDEGVAYRWSIQTKNTYYIKGEKASFNFPEDRMAWLPYSTNPDKPLAMAFQNFYDHTLLSQAKDTPAFLPVSIDCGKAKVTITESDLEAYPGMFVQKQGHDLQGLFAPYPTKTDYYPWRKQEYVTETADYIAIGQGKRDLPWRILAVSHADQELPVNNLVYALASPNRIGDTSWIKGGKVAWDWWNDWNLRNVPFRAGINMDTYKYYIDFAASHNIEYIVLDEGWYEPKSGDMLTIIPDLDLPSLIAYGKDRGVDIILWTVFNVLDSQLEAACSKYAAMGIKGFKVDFLDRDDQTAVEMAYRIAEGCARHHMLLDYHGYYKPTGLSRTYPNVVNYEAVFGMEEMKWSPKEVDMPLYDVTFPFIRMMCGPVDYTPGAMRNATRADWSAAYSSPMSQGTRCHQLATYVVHDSPLTMLADVPTAYQQEPEYTRFLCSLPNTYLHTWIPQGEIGEYIVTVRQNTESVWSVGGLTNWDARDLTLSFDFLPADGAYMATFFCDGINADRNAQDYMVKKMQVNNQSKEQIHLAPGGGFAIRIEKQ